MTISGSTMTKLRSLPIEIPSLDIENYKRIPSLSQCKNDGTVDIDPSSSTWNVPTTDEYCAHHSSQTVPDDDLISSLSFKSTNLFKTSDPSSIESIDAHIDNDTCIQSERLFFDPDPEIIVKPQMITPIVYKQNITVKFLKPPAVRHEPLIIREIRSTQPPLRPPLVR
jgi:hypothetical protein